MSSPNLGLQYSSLAGSAYGYPERVGEENIENANLDTIDLFAGSLSSSFITRFYVSGAMATKAGQLLGIDVGMYNRTIKSISVFNETSGSGATPTVIDFRHNDINILSSSINLHPVSGSSYFQTQNIFISGAIDYMMPAYEPLKILCTSVNPGTGLNAQANVLVFINWVPSGTLVTS